MPGDGKLGAAQVGKWAPWQALLCPHFRVSLALMHIMVFFTSRMTELQIQNASLHTQKE